MSNSLSTDNHIDDIIFLVQNMSTSDFEPIDMVSEDDADVHVLAQCELLSVSDAELEYELLTVSDAEPEYDLIGLPDVEPEYDLIGLPEYSHVSVPINIISTT